MPSADLVKTLVAVEGRPWAEMGKAGKPLTQNKLASMLKPLKITTENIRVGDKVPKGYVFEHFAEAFGRYLPPEGGFEPLDRYNADETGTSDLFQTATYNPDVADRKCDKSANGGHCSGIADGKGSIGDRNGAGLSNGARRQLADLARALAEELRQGGAELDMGKLKAVIRDRVQAAGIDSDQVEAEIAIITDMMFQ